MYTVLNTVVLLCPGGKGFGEQLVNVSHTDTWEVVSIYVCKVRMNYLIKRALAEVILYQCSCLSDSLLPSNTVIKEK